MAKAEVAVPFNNSILDRRRCSLVDHVNRIRTANSKRQCVPWYETINEQKSSKDCKRNKSKRASSLSELTKSSRHDCCYEYAESDSLEDLDESDEIKIKKDPFISNKISLDSVKLSSSQRRDKSDKNLVIQTRTHRKSIQPKKSRDKNLQKSTKKTKKNVRKGDATKEKRREKSKDGEIDRNDLLQKEDSDYSKQNSNHSEKFINSKKTHTLKDIIVLKWLHKLECPAVANENKFQSEESKKAPIRILKRNLNSPVERSAKTATKETSKSARNNSKSLEKNISSLGEINVKTDKRGTKRKSFKIDNKEKSLKAPKYSESDEEVSNSTPSDSNDECNEFESNVHKSASGEDSRVLPDVEMYVSELEKLQIVMNLKSISPEDAAVLVWLDDLPESLWKPDYRRRLSITSIKDMETPDPSKRSETVLKSRSAQDLEDFASSRPNIYFPSVTVLKNLAADSKVELESLNKDFLNSIYYKRCNLIHTDGEEFSE